MVLVVEVALPALFRHLEELVAVLAPAAKVAVLPALRRVDGLGVMDEAILPGVMDHVLAHRENARHEGARVEVDLSALPVQGVTGVAGIGRGADVVAAAADQAAAAVPLVAVAVLAALLLGEAVQQLRVPAAVVISPDAQGVAGGGERQIDRVIIALQLDKVEIRIIRDPVGLLAQGTADEVGDALLVVHRAVIERLGPGVGMVVAGQDHIDPGLLRRRIDLLLGNRAHAGSRVGVVDRLVHDQDLPGGVGRLGVADQLGQGLGGEAVIGQGGHENVAVDRAVVVAVALVIEGGVGVAAAVLLVVAHGEEAAAGQPVQHGEGLVPVAVVSAVVHQVAGLDGQVIVRQVQPVQDASQRRVVALLQVAEDQRLHVGVDIARGEAADLRPARPVAHLIVVGGAGLQVLRLGAADIGRRAVREGQQAAGAVIDRALRQGVLALRQAQLGALGRLGGVCQPAHVQAVGTVGGIAPDMGGRSVRLALGQVDGSRQGGGNAALAVSGRHRQGRLLPVDRDEHLALRVRGPQQRLALVEPHAQGRLAGGRMGDEEVAGLRETHHHSAGAHGIGRGDGQGDGVAEACLPGKTADDAGEVGAGHGAGGHLHSQGGHGAAVHRTVDGKAQNLRCAVIVRFDGLSLCVRQDVALGKGRRQLHIRRHRGDRVVPGSEIQGHGPAQHRAGLVGRHLDGGALALGVVHRDLIALGRLVAVAVHHGDLDGVAAVGQLQAGPQLSGAGDAVHLPAVHIEGGVVHARVVAVVRHAVAEGGLDVDGAARKAHARLQFLLLVHDHGLDDRVGLVLRGAAVNEGQVIEIERPLVR